MVYPLQKSSRHILPLCTILTFLFLFCLFLRLTLYLGYCEDDLTVVLRFLADSNRRTRFCRPLTKPLIQGTLSLAIFVSRLRLQRYDIFFNLQIFCYFFLTFSAFFSQPYFGLFCIDFMAQSELQHSHGLLLFFMRLKY